MTELPTLAELYAQHQGKASDKWSSYLPTYDRLFAHLRTEWISLLEIGVQNGGSLEIWSQYFRNGMIKGLDINPRCRELKFDCDRIAVWQGDASKFETTWKFDIIIDDGSHKPDEQIDALSSLWPSLRAGGIYVIEDLHCDGCEKTARRFAEIIAAPLATDTRAGSDIARIEFLNSMIVIVKGDGSLGKRIVTGQDQSICPVLHLNGEVRRA